MARKSKQAGSGHLPLTNFERKQYSKGTYGTTTARLSASSQRTFGHCSLSLHPAQDQPVATPSGHIYERSAIIEYLLTKTQQLKKEQSDYEAWCQRKEQTAEDEKEKKRKSELDSFEDAQKVVVQKKAKTEVNPLKQSSFWLAQSQPEIKDSKTVHNPEGSPSSSALVTYQEKKAPPKRPPSPNSQKPLRRKDLIPLDLKWKQDRAICAISEKTIVSHPALALIPKRRDVPAQVVLAQVFDDLNETKVCPVTGRALAKILRLQQGGSSFAGGGGAVEAKTYRPTMT